MTETPVLTKYYSNRIVTVWPEPHPCRCKQMHTVFITRNGNTGCPNCDEELPRRAA